MKAKEIVNKLLAPRLSWRAIRRGHTYCAPACGCKCTWDAYQNAIAESKALAAFLGKGWTTRVHENCGWHWEVQSPCKRIRVSPCRNRNGKVTSYTAYLGKKNDCGGRYAEHGRTAKSAIRNTITVAREDLAQMGAMFVSLPSFDVYPKGLFPVKYRKSRKKKS